MPYGFSWIDHPHLAAMAFPAGPEALEWLRAQKIDLVLTLTEDSIPKHWIDTVGLLAVHLPIDDGEAPTPEQIDLAMATLENARGASMGAAVHCLAGRGRTGTILALWLVKQGIHPDEAIRRIRQLRPGSIETLEQEECIRLYARRRPTNGA